MDHRDESARSTSPPAAVQTVQVEGLPVCTVTRTPDGAWRATTQLADSEQAALAAALQPMLLCQRAQHVLGLAGVSSRITPDNSAVGVYAAPYSLPSGAIAFVIEGQALLWSLSQARSKAIEALVTAILEGIGSAGDGHR